MIIGYQPGTGPLHRAHPLTTLTIAGTVAALAFVLPGPVGPAVLVLAVVLTAVFEKVPRILRVALIIAAPFWVFAALLHGVIAQDPTRAVTLSARITAMIVVFLVVLASVHPARLVDALVARRIPFELAYLLSATLQAVPRLRARAREIIAAQRCRGLRVRGPFARRIGVVIPLALPLILGALAEVDERAIALEARGAASPSRRTPLNPPVDSTVDRLTRWSLGVALVVALAIRVLA